MWQKAKNIYHLLVAVAANVRYGFPGKKLIVIGVTGTDGKTTTSSLIYHILKTAGAKVALISTVEAIIDNKVYDTGFHVTNPSSFPLQRFLKKAVETKTKYLVLEVTSHGIDQERIWGIPFAMSVLTNITSEHLDYHKTYNNYLRTKAKLLERSKLAILNKDDMSYEKVLPLLHKKIISYSQEKKADSMPEMITLPAHFLGKHNLSNALAAKAVADKLGISKSDVNRALKTFVFPTGRGQLVYENSFSVMVDFAHTPNAFEQLLSTLRTQVKGRLIHVFGSAGERDKNKRPMMGKIASVYDDVIILTSEDPRSERPEDIMDDIEKGMQKSKKLTIFRLPIRTEALQKAISLAKKGDFVIATGKAHEKSMNYGQGEEPWDEFAEIAKVIKTHENS